MKNSHQALWDDCLRLIQANVTEQQYKTWFAPIVFESYSEAEQTLLVQVPSRYVYEYLEQYYVGLLSKVLARVFGANIRLSYRIVEVKGRQRDVTTDVESEGPSTIDAPQPTTRGNKTPTTLDSALPQALNPQLDPKKTFQNFKSLNDQISHAAYNSLANEYNAVFKASPLSGISGQKKADLFQ